jgi:hypothetical protein
MKTRTTLIILGISIVMASCMQGPKGEKVQTGEATNVEFASDAIKLNVDLQNSKVEWLGTKPTGTHFGTLGIQEGSLFVKNGELLGGKFTFDMNAIVVLDLTDEGMNQKLLGHLKSEDFFLVDSFPTASFEFSTVKPIANRTETAEGIIPTHTIEGNLTLRGVTRKVNFSALINVSNDNVVAQSPQFVINRTEWNVNYGSKSIFANLKDNFIHDEIGITISLSTK